MTNYPKHYCGVFGAYKSLTVGDDIYLGLYALQHRGQESAGIVSTDGEKFYSLKGMGLVSQVFPKSSLGKLGGSNGVGHNRYSTTGESSVSNIQPLVITCKRGQIGLAHNGQLTNAERLREELQGEGAVFQTTTDSEVMLHILARSDAPLDEAILKMMDTVKGAYSLVILTPDELIAVRDPHGFRPLSIGKRGDTWFVSSETCAFDTISAEFVRDVEAGEIVFIRSEEIRSVQKNTVKKKAFCIFEFVYFARPDSKLEGSLVYDARVRMGKELAHEHPIEGDVVVPILDGGMYAALGLAEERKIPLNTAYIRNHYVGRSFLEPNQNGRDTTARLKLSLIPDLVKEKRVILVDDSVVRGTTIENRVKEIRKAGAKEVHLLVSCPPHRFGCHYGIDFPDPAKLIATTRTNEEIRVHLGLDYLGYLSEAGLVKAVGQAGVCLACFNGQYPVVPEHLPKVS